MRIAYCPNCGKAGLRWEDTEGHYPWEIGMEGKRFCPRCNAWVVPERRKAMTHARPGKAGRVRLR